MQFAVLFTRNNKHGECCSSYNPSPINRQICKSYKRTIFASSDINYWAIYLQTPLWLKGMLIYVKLGRIICTTRSEFSNSIALTNKKLSTNISTYSNLESSVQFHIYNRLNNHKSYETALEISLIKNRFCSKKNLQFLS